MPARRRGFTGWNTCWAEPMAAIHLPRTIRIGGVAVNEIQHWEFADVDPDDAKVKKKK